MQAPKVNQEKNGLRVVAYPGNNKILLAMSLDDSAINATDKNLAGFAIWRKPKGKAEAPLGNRLNFKVEVTSSDTTTGITKWFDSDKAPFQKFRWVDVPPDGFNDTITYRVKALYFAGTSGAALKDGPQVTIDVPCESQAHKKFHPGFTRGYIASQAYADKFKNKDIRPKGKKTADFDTKPFAAQYEWLGADAHKKLFDFIDDCEKDTNAKVDVFIYDNDHPDVIAAICRIGKQGRLRAIIDNAQLHTKTGAVEITAAKMITDAAGAANVKRGCFDRFQHNKVFIKSDKNGKAQRVFFGSMNFSIRGLYVQANNVIVVDDPATAQKFKDAFDNAFENAFTTPAKKDKLNTSKFAAGDFAQGYMTLSATDTADLPKFSLALSPHKDSSVSLGPMSDRIRSATSSVLYAVMAPTGSGPVLTSLREIAANPIVFSYGTVETDKGLAVQSPNGAMGAVTGFAALTKNVPPPFTAEFAGGTGMHIHNKFVVVDFNGDHPTVFTGSSNLAAGGEEANGDSLAMIEDEAVANMYAIEAVSQFDHYHYRSAKRAATKSAPLMLWFPGQPNKPSPWWKSYYDKTTIQMRDRCLFADVSLPPGMEAVKTPDWTSLDKAAASAAKKKAPAKKASSKKASTKKATSSKKTAAKKAAKKRSSKKR